MDWKTQIESKRLEYQAIMDRIEGLPHDSQEGLDLDNQLYELELEIMQLFELGGYQITWEDFHYRTGIVEQFLGSNQTVDYFLEANKLTRKEGK